MREIKKNNEDMTDNKKDRYWAERRGRGIVTMGVSAWVRWTRMY